LVGGTIATGDAFPDRVAVVVTPAVLTDRRVEIGPMPVGVKATATRHVAWAVRVTPQVSALAVNWDPARDATVGLIEVELWLVTVKVTGGELEPSSTVP
jgi:hypothetical protein